MTARVRGASASGRRSGQRCGRARGRCAWPVGGRRGDDGQVTILVIGFVVVALALIAVVVSATQVHLERTRLAALADLAALHAAEQVSDQAYFAPAGDSSEGAALAVSDDEVATTVDAYLTAHSDAAARWTELRVVEADAADGRTVHVLLGAVVRPAWTAWVLAPFTDGIAIEASSSARAW